MIQKLFLLVFVLPVFCFGSEGRDEKVNEKPKVVYPEKTKLEFEGAQIEGELRNSGEFYFKHRTDEKHDSLLKRKKNFHREMLRDVVLSK